MDIRFYEKVVVVRSAGFPDKVGEEGVVLGISRDDDRVYSYSVFFPGDPEGVSFAPDEVRGTGEVVDRAAFYDPEDRVRVGVEDGEGTPG